MFVCYFVCLTLVLRPSRPVITPSPRRRAVDGTAWYGQCCEGLLRGANRGLHQQTDRGGMVRKGLRQTTRKGRVAEVVHRVTFHPPGPGPGADFRPPGPGPGARTRSTRTGTGFPVRVEAGSARSPKPAGYPVHTRSGKPVRGGKYRCFSAFCTDPARVGPDPDRVWPKPGRVPASARPVSRPDSRPSVPGPGPGPGGRIRPGSCRKSPGPGPGAPPNPTRTRPPGPGARPGKTRWATSGSVGSCPLADATLSRACLDCRRHRERRDGNLPSASGGATSPLERGEVAARGWSCGTALPRHRRCQEQQCSHAPRARKLAPALVAPRHGPV